MHGSLIFIRRKDENWEFSEAGNGWQALESATQLRACEALEEVSWLYPHATLAIGDPAAMRVVSICSNRAERTHAKTPGHVKTRPDVPEVA